MKKFIFTLSLIVLIVFAGTVVLAEGKVTPSILPSTTQITEGSELTVTLRVEDISFPLGISTITLVVDYEDSVFEAIDNTSFDALNNWTESFDALSRELTLTREQTAELQKEAGDVVKVDFRAKPGTNGKSTAISFKNMSFTDGINQPFQAADISTPTITVGEVQVIQPVEPVEPTPDPGGSLNPIIKKDDPEPEAPEEIPETGLSDNMTYIIAGIVVLAGVFYVNYKKFDRKNVRYVNVK